MATKTTKKSKPARRAVIVAGLRTPFVKAFGELMKVDTIGLGTCAVRGLLKKTGVARADVQAVRWGGVILPGGAPNVGREIALELGMHHAEAMTVTRACASGLQAITCAANEIERGHIDVAIAGGSDSTSNAEVPLPQKLIHALAPLAFGKASPADLLGVLSQLTPLSEILPRRPRVAERSTDELMGEAAERMAVRNAIRREEQDAFAVTSHHRAAAATASGRLAMELTAVDAPGGRRVITDGLIRGDTSVEKLARLRPVFTRSGTLTAGNSSALTDGASAVLLMSEEKAKALGIEPLCALRSWAYVGVDPADQLLMGPALSMPLALERAGLGLGDMDLVDIHEAFAAQVLCILKMLASDAFARERLGSEKAIGEIDPNKLNVHGGSVAIGHPFGATGARMVTTMANELVLRDKQFALLGICAAGGLGAGAVLERC